MANNPGYYRIKAISAMPKLFPYQLSDLHLEKYTHFCILFMVT